MINKGRIVCTKCNGFGGKLAIKQVTGERQPLVVKEPCIACWGRGYIEDMHREVPKQEQNMKYFMYP